MIVIFASAKNDMEFLLSKSEIISRETFGQAEIWEVYLCDRKTLLVSTGYNKVNLGMAAGYIANRYEVDMIIGLGNCGLLKGCDLKIGDIAIGSSSVQYTVDSSAIGYPDTVIPGVGLGVFYSTHQLVEVAKNACQELGYKCKAGKIATAEKFVAENRDRSYIAEKYDSEFIDMECGCAAEIAYIFNIPVVFVKGISNYADCEADADYQAYENQSNLRSNEVVLAMLRKLECDCPDNACRKCDVDLKHFKELTDREIKNVILASKYASLGVSENDAPYVVPMCFEYNDKCPNRIQLISMPYGKKMTCMKNNDKVALEFMVQTPSGFKSVVALGRAIIETQYRGCCDDYITEIMVEVCEMTGREYKRCR